MDNWQDSLTDFIPVIAFIGMCNILRGLLALELEKKLGKKLTDWEWQYYLHEGFRKAEADLQQEKARQRIQRFADMQVIHDFVWNQDEEKMM
jgi:hypothetical protein